MNTIKTSMLTDEQLNKMSKDDIIIAYKLQSNAFVDMEGKLQWFMEQVHLNNQKKYGPSSEKWAYPDGYEQMNIFNEAEATANPSEEEPEYEEVVVKRKKATRSKGKKELDLSKFPVEHKIIELSEEEKSCVQCGEGRLEQFTSEKNRYLKFIPAQFIVEEIETEIYKCNTTDCGNIVRPKKDPSLFKGSIATPSLVSSIINNKYVNALPLARQEREFTRQGVNLSRQTMANWMIYSSEYYLSAIYDEFHKRLMTYPAIQADETRVQVLKEENRKSETQSAMWIYRSSELCKMAPVVIFNYQMTRAGYHPKNFLKNYSGYLTVDGYKVYHGLPKEIVVTGCFAHARRYMKDHYEAIPAEHRKGSVGEKALRYIAKLYRIEKKLKDKSAKERFEYRQEHSKPILDEYFSFLQPLKKYADAKSLIGKAIRYSLNQKKYLEKYLLDGIIPLDNNASERCAKMFAVGRKNWLFSNTPKGATASAILYSVVETAKENNLKPLQYVEYVLDKMRKNPELKSDPDFIQDLLPWSDKIPTNCRM